MFINVTVPHELFCRYFLWAFPNLVSFMGYTIELLVLDVLGGSCMLLLIRCI